MAPHEINKRHTAIRVADALNAIEGAPVSTLAKKLSLQWANGDISAAEMKEQLLKVHRRA